MEQVNLSISDVSKKVEVEPRVLRYWEEELELHIPRNAQGHRLYGESEIGVINDIKRLKSQGFQLKAIKVMLPKMDKIEQLPDNLQKKLCADLNAKLSEQEGTEVVISRKVNLPVTEKKTEPDTKVSQFATLMGNIMKQVLEENTKNMSKEIAKEVGTQMTKELEYQFRQQEEKAEAHYRKIDEMIRAKQSRKKRKRKSMGVF